MKEELKKRTQLFAISVIKLVEQIPSDKPVKAIANQLIRSGTSIGANYRAACRAKSKKDFLNKILIVEEEADETLYWLEILKKIGLVSENILNPIILECNELVAIFTAIGKTTRKKLQKL